MRKELDKTKTKLRDTESKLRNAIQEKTKLEGEKASADREIKCSNMFDSKRAKNSALQQEECRKLDKMEAAILSLEKELTISCVEKEAAMSQAEFLEFELQALSSNEWNKSTLLKEEVSCLRSSLEESESRCHNLESSVNYLVEEKEYLAMQLGDALLAMDETKAIWVAKEKATIEATDEKTKSFSAEIATLSKTMREVTNELEVRQKQCKLLEERLIAAENNSLLDKHSSEEREREIDQLKLELRLAQEQSKKYFKCVQDEVNDRKEKGRLRMQLHWCRAKLDAFRIRYKEAVDEIYYMNKKFEEASSNLKEKLVQSGLETLSLKKRFVLGTAP